MGTLVHGSVSLLYLSAKRLLKRFRRYDELAETGQGASRATVEFYYNYNTLLLASFGLENALQRSPIDVPLYFHKVYEAAWVGLVVRLPWPCADAFHRPSVRSRSRRSRVQMKSPTLPTVKMSSCRMQCYHY